MAQAQFHRDALRADPRLGQDQRGHTGQSADFLAPERDDFVQRAAACLGAEQVHRDGGDMGTGLARREVAAQPGDAADHQRLCLGLIRGQASVHAVERCLDLSHGLARAR